MDKVIAKRTLDKSRNGLIADCALKACERARGGPGCTSVSRHTGAVVRFMRDGLTALKSHATTIPSYRSDVHANPCCKYGNPRRVSG